MGELITEQVALVNTAREEEVGELVTELAALVNWTREQEEVGELGCVTRDHSPLGSSFSKKTTVASEVQTSDLLTLGISPGSEIIHNPPLIGVCW